MRVKRFLYCNSIGQLKNEMILMLMVTNTDYCLLCSSPSGCRTRLDDL